MKTLIHLSFIKLYKSRCNLTFSRKFSITNIIVLLESYLSKCLIISENYFLNIFFTTEYFTKVFFNLNFLLNKTLFYFKLLKYSLTFNKINKVILRYFYKPVKLEKISFFSNSVGVAVPFNPYTKKRYFFSNLTQNLYFNNILIYSTTNVNAKNIIYILYDNVNKLFINEKVRIYFSTSTILNCIDNEYNNINFFDHKDRQYLFKKNLVLLEKQYGPCINTYIYVNYLFTKFYLNDESLENLEINLNDSFVTKSSLQFFIQYCLTCKLKDDAFYNCLFLLLQKVKLKTIKYKNKKLNLIYYFIPLLSLVLLNNIAYCVYETKLSNLFILDVFSQIQKIKTIPSFYTLPNKHDIYLSKLLHNSRMLNPYCFEKTTGRIGYFTSMQNQSLAYVYTSLIYQLRPNIDFARYVNLLLSDQGKPGWFSQEIATTFDENNPKPQTYESRGNNELFSRDLEAQKIINERNKSINNNSQNNEGNSMKNKKHLQIMNNFLYFLVGLVLSSWLVYNRFIREREPRPLPEVLSASQLCLYISLFSISILIFILFVFRYLKKNNKLHTEIPFKQLSFSQLWFKTFFILIRNIPEKLSNLLKESFRELHAFIVSPVPNYIRLHLCISKFFVQLDFKEQVLILVMFVFLPQILVSIGFAIDVFYVHQWNGFYKLLICLGYPMIFNAYIGILNQLYDMNFDLLKSMLKETFDEITQEWVIRFTGTERDFNQFDVATLKEIIDIYYCGFRDMKNLIIFPFEELKAYYGSQILLLTSLIYSSGWLYVILHGLHVISY